MVAVQDAGLALMGNHAGLHPKERTHIGHDRGPLAADERLQMTRGWNVRCPAKDRRAGDPRYHR
jgi:hypothetical protein